MRILGNDRSRTRFFTSSVNHVGQPLLQVIATTEVFYTRHTTEMRGA